MVQIQVQSQVHDAFFMSDLKKHYDSLIYMHKNQTVDNRLTSSNHCKSIAIIYQTHALSLNDKPNMKSPNGRKLLRALQQPFNIPSRTYLQ